MNTYLLLRDNKQTGPYTAEELAAKGLKPYDLVWLEGRSAAWRYPSEIEELKSFAPGVEEQPYDRFYKKQGEATASTVTEQHQATANNVQQEQQPVNKGKHIYVTMPGGKTAVPVAKKEEAAKPVARQNDKNAYAATQKNTENKAATYLISEEDDELNSSLLKGYNSRKKEDDEINNGFLSDYEARKAAFSGKRPGSSTIKQTAEKPVERPAAARSKTSWSTTAKKDQFDWKALVAGSGKYLQDNKNVTRTLVAAVLILAGVVIGLVINAGREHPDAKALESLVKEIREQQNEKVSTAAPDKEKEKVAKKRTEQREEERPAATDNANNDVAEPAPPPAASVTSNPPAQSNMRQAVIKKDNNIVPPPQQNRSIVVPVSNSTPQSETVTTVETREKTNNQEAIEKARRNIYEQVRAEASAFKVGLLGGISDLDITVFNSSPYTLDQVAVEVKYYGMEKKLVKTQTIIFNNVPAGKRRTLEVPSTKRGISIDYSITSINSKALGLAAAGF
ncbi:DUF4339 domain-containing protein [Longitalea luteola]|uniref:DUF4339 domain-containing protein n=1 Tax=Longitalea luteola TaxID=2812563 RepID=UPI001A959F21|nr:DUF4339 domain-containing protein [Longitalea luteola]